MAIKYPQHDLPFDFWGRISGASSIWGDDSGLLLIGEYFDSSSSLPDIVGTTYYQELGSDGFSSEILLECAHSQVSQESGSDTLSCVCSVDSSSTITVIEENDNVSSEVSIEVISILDSSETLQDIISSSFSVDNASSSALFEIGEDYLTQSVSTDPNFVASIEEEGGDVFSSEFSSDPYYELQVKDNVDTEWRILAILPVNETSFDQIDDLVNNRTYFARVRLVVSGIPGDWSNTAELFFSSGIIFSLEFQEQESDDLYSEITINVSSNTYYQDENDSAQVSCTSDANYNAAYQEQVNDGFVCQSLADCQSQTYFQETNNDSFNSTCSVESSYFSSVSEYSDVFSSVSNFVVSSETQIQETSNDSFYADMVVEDAVEGLFTLYYEEPSSDSVSASFQLLLSGLADFQEVGSDTFHQDSEPQIFSNVQLIEQGEDSVTVTSSVGVYLYSSIEEGQDVFSSEFSVENALNLNTTEQQDTVFVSSIAALESETNYTEEEKDIFFYLGEVFTPIPITEEEIGRSVVLEGRNYSADYDSSNYVAELGSKDYTSVYKPNNYSKGI